MEASKAREDSACWRCEIEKCVRRGGRVAEGPRSTAAKGRLSSVS